MPAAARPRIVKLHGSFPSTRPFVLTEEDFRTYPRRFAPFVNLAQQAVMENAVCLVGFSGDDPNFLYWTGWVRDNLGSYAPNIYLCGVLGLSGSQRLLLSARKVTPVDFAPLFPRDRYPDPAARHEAALDWFLNCLKAGRPHNPIEWPDSPHDRSGGLGHLPVLLPSREVRPLEERWHPTPSINPAATASEQALIELRIEVKAWKHNRAIYPGWLVAPSEVRKRLWFTTEGWQGQFLKVRPSLGVVEQLDIVSELNWRLETALLPVWSDLLPAYQHALGAVNPFPKGVTDLPNATLVLDAATAGDPDWPARRRQWLEVALGLLRNHREERNDPEFEAWHARLAGIPDLDGDAKARLCHERCLFALANLDDQAAHDSVASWPQDARDPFWAVRHAAVLAELARTAEALGLAEAALEVIRRGVRDDPRRIPELSREGWAMWLLMALRGNACWTSQSAIHEMANLRAEIRDRYRQLARHWCSPDDLIDYFKSRLDQPNPSEKPQGQFTPGFQPGTGSTSHHSGGDVFKKLLPAYQYLRLVEEAALPPQFGQSNIGMERLTGVADWFIGHDSVRTQSITLRLRGDGLIQRYLSRHRVAALLPEVVAGLTAVSRRAIEWSLPKLTDRRPESDPERRAASVFGAGVELLSRVCIRASEVELASIWELAARLYNSPAVQHSTVGGDQVGQLYECLVNATPRAELARRLPELARLPIPGENGCAVAIWSRWYDPTVTAVDALGASDLPRVGAEWRGVKGRLFELAKAADPKLKLSALLRLYVLSVRSALTAQECRRLGQMFWSAELDANGLPSRVWDESAAWYALRFPVPPKRDPGECVKRLLLSAPPCGVHEGVVWSRWVLKLFLSSKRPLGNLPVPAGRRFVDWDAADAERLFETIRTWWAAHGTEVARPTDRVRFMQSFSGGSTEYDMSLLTDVLRLVVMPNLPRRPPLAERVLAFVGELSSANLPTGAVLPATLWLRRDRLDRVVSALRDDFANPAQEVHLSALKGTVFWVEWNATLGLKRNSKLPEVPIELLREVATAVAFRRPDTLALSLDAAYHVLRGLGPAADGQFVRSLLIGLHNLSGELAYRAATGVGDRVRYEDVPRLRFLTARLAKCLAEYGQAEAPAVRRWCEAAAADPLPEVRRAAQQADDGGDD